MPFVNLRPVRRRVIPKSLYNCQSRPHAFAEAGCGNDKSTCDPDFGIAVLESKFATCQSTPAHKYDKNRNSRNLVRQVFNLLIGQHGQNRNLPYIRSILGPEILSKEHQKIANAVKNSPIQQLVIFPVSTPFEAHRTPSLTNQNFLNNNLPLLQSQ